MSGTLRLVTLNTWKGDGAYAKRLAAMTAGLAALSPDIVTLQEVLAVPESGCDTAARLAAALGLNAATLPLRRKPRVVADRLVDSTSGVAILSRYPLRSQRAVPLSVDPRDGERAALIAEIDVQGRSITVVCVHFTHLGDAGELRRRQWREVRAAVAGRAPAIIAGDFNAPIEGFDLGAFADSRQACAQAATSTVLDPNVPACLDHVLCSGRGLGAIGWRTALGAPPPGCEAVPSDHLAVVVDFTFG